MGQFIHHQVRDLTGATDPYHQAKVEFNEKALGWYPDMKKKVVAADDPLEAAARLAIAGNIIDFGARPGLEEEHVLEVVAAALERPLFGAGIAAFRKAVNKAGSILYLGDNAGEIVFDRLLIEELEADRVTFVVKQQPILNDATMEDAEVAGLTGLVRVMDNGSDAPGTILSQCSEEFLDRFRTSDLIISKGQGNYETLSDTRDDIFFLLMAKCAVIAGDVGCEQGSMVLTAKEVR
jgi:uncharacterized protein with ATP-grasp and redox domains